MGLLFVIRPLHNALQFLQTRHRLLQFAQFVPRQCALKRHSHLRFSIGQYQLIGSGRQGFPFLLVKQGVQFADREILFQRLVRIGRQRLDPRSKSRLGVRVLLEHQ